jgi:hypothetical protein
MVTGYSALGQKNNAMLRMRGHQNPNQNAKGAMQVLVDCAFAPYLWWMRKEKTGRI